MEGVPRRGKRKFGKRELDEETKKVRKILEEIIGDKVSMLTNSVIVEAIEHTKSVGEASNAILSVFEETTEEVKPIYGHLQPHFFRKEKEERERGFGRESEGRLGGRGEEEEVKMEAFDYKKGRTFRLNSIKGFTREKNEASVSLASIFKVKGELKSAFLSSFDIDLQFLLKEVPILSKIPLFLSTDSVVCSFPHLQFLTLTLSFEKKR